MEAVRLTGWNEDEISSAHGKIRIPALEAGASGDNEVNLIFRVRLLRIGRTSGQPVDARAHIRPAEEFKIVLTDPAKLIDLKSLHGRNPPCCYPLTRTNRMRSVWPGLAGLPATTARMSPGATSLCFSSVSVASISVDSLSSVSGMMKGVTPQ